MKKFLPPAIGRFPHAILALLILIFGCATLPPAQPAKDSSHFVGRWEGKIWNVDQDWNFHILLTAEEEGIFVLTLPAYTDPGLARIVGKWGVKDEKLWFKSEVLWMNGRGTLHEGEGKCVVVFHGDDGRTTGWVMPFSKTRKLPELK